MDNALNPRNLDAFASLAWAWSLDFVPRIVSAIIVLCLGLFVAQWASRSSLRFLVGAAHVDPTIRPILASTVRYAIIVLVLIAALSQIGVQTTSLLAVLGAAGLAIGLALQGTLSNIAAGIMLIWLRPFRIGDYIEVIAGNPVAGAVREIGLFTSLIETYDGILVFAPNSTIWNFPLRNHTRNGRRLLSFAVGLPESSNIERARSVLLEWLAGDPHVLKTPPPDVFVDRLDSGESSVICRLWTAPANLGALQRDWIERAKDRLTAADGEALAPRRIARIVPPDSDPSRLMAAEGAEPEVAPKTSADVPKRGNYLRPRDF
jgi:small conductance mechanosensitive channel